MDLIQNIKSIMDRAASCLEEKNRRAAYLNRIRTVIRCEENASEREFLALGRYYYNNLRDRNNPVTEAHCAELDQIEARVEKALKQMEDFYAAQEAEAEEKKAAAQQLAEEITLEDVESYDSDPMPEETSVEEVREVVESLSEKAENIAETAEETAEAAAETAEDETEKISEKAAELTENDDLPFEG